MDVLGPVKSLLGPAPTEAQGQPRRASGSRDDGGDFSAVLAQGDSPNHYATPPVVDPAEGEHRPLRPQMPAAAADASSAGGGGAVEDRHAPVASGERAWRAGRGNPTGAGSQVSPGGDAATRPAEDAAYRRQAPPAGAFSFAARDASAFEGPVIGQPASWQAGSGDAAFPKAQAARRGGIEAPLSGAASGGRSATSPRGAGPAATNQPVPPWQTSRPAPAEAGAVPGRSQPSPPAAGRSEADATGSLEGRRKATTPQPRSGPWQAGPHPAKPQTGGGSGLVPHRSAATSPEARRQQAPHLAGSTDAGPEGPGQPAAREGPAQRPPAGAAGTAAGPAERASAVPQAATRSEPGRPSALAEAARRPGNVGEGAVVSGPERLAGVEHGSVTRASAGAAAGGAGIGPRVPVVGSSGAEAGRGETRPARHGNGPAAASGTVSPASGRPAGAGLPRQATAETGLPQQAAADGATGSQWPAAATGRAAEPLSATVPGDRPASRGAAQPVAGPVPVPGRDVDAPAADRPAAMPAPRRPAGSADRARPRLVAEPPAAMPARHPSRQAAGPTVPPSAPVAGPSGLSVASAADMPAGAVAAAPSEAPALGAASALAAGAELQQTAPSPPSSPASSSGVALETVRQLVDALPGNAAGDRTVISLEPPELGHVEIEFKQDLGRMTATVSVERPETLDLLRRHVDMLMRDLAAAGYAEAEVAFGDGSALGQRDQGQESGLPGADDEEAWASEAGPVADQASRPRGIVAGRLDIRL